jgi:protein SCO1/2
LDLLIGKIIFNFSPDICPDELEKMSEAISILDEMGYQKDIVPVFITIDPERDTKEVVSQYIKEFHPRFVGLTGTLEQTTAAAKAFRIYVSKGISVGDDYLVDHSIFFFLMNPEFGFVDFFGRNSSSDDVVSKVNKYITSWKRDLDSTKI